MSNRALILLLLTLPAMSLPAKKISKAAPGVAWQVRGSWHNLGKSLPIVAGDAIPPGSLLQPDEGTGNHSITILLPDGQRILYECFTAEDCARGFRVPSLYRKPGPFAVDMLARVRTVLVRENRNLSKGSGMDRQPDLPRDEVVAVLDSANQVRLADPPVGSEIGPIAIQAANLIADLPDGRYTYDLVPLARAYPRQFHRSFEKKGPFILLDLPGTGLYDIRIADDLNRPRLDLFIAAVPPAKGAGVERSFLTAQGVMRKWNTYYQGWPIHDFQRAYLESLLLDTKPLRTAGQRDGAVKIASSAEEGRRFGVTAEPEFTPKPGVFGGDTAVTLRCHTPGATMHYTVDGSQPLASSPVYGAPIMVKGTELTIKSFASVKGRKDSPVVTGIFRIQE